MRNKRVATFVAVLMLIGLTVAYAAYSWPTQWLATPGTFEAEWGYYDDNGDARQVKVYIAHDSYNSTTETVSVSAQVTVDERGVIDAIHIQTCNDTNANGNIEAGEWADRATGTVTNTNNSSIATVAPVDLDVKYDGYRLKWVWEDGGFSFDQMLAPGLTAD